MLNYTGNFMMINKFSASVAWQAVDVVWCLFQL